MVRLFDAMNVKEYWNGRTRDVFYVIAPVVAGGNKESH